MNTANIKPEKLGQDVGFERIRRITGYLVGTMDQWNNAKRAEERDRVKHTMKNQKWFFFAESTERVRFGAFCLSFANNIYMFTKDKPDGGKHKA